ncbi:hypothetical protein [Parashewanella tropica]|uniref:hypothetical protein n=1 Tax=Parashewanella tropica TaxID=2547970 RepID=UPI0010593781|nr:hypothetical protein [Parashewanella tropica]
MGRFMGEYLEFPLESWMEHFSRHVEAFKYKTLIDITMPGSHDAATYTMSSSAGAKFAVTQTKTLVEQFNLGVRYFDIRVRQVDGKQMSFFHGSVDSKKEDVFPNLMAFFSTVLLSNEVVIIKLHFSGVSDFELFRKLYINEDIKALILTPYEFTSEPLENLLGTKKLVILTNHGGLTDISVDYNKSTTTQWGKTRDPKKLLESMNETRATLDMFSRYKLKVVQTNQPALVGSGSNRFISVLDQDAQPESRATVRHFVNQSKHELIRVKASKNMSHFRQVQMCTRGVISLDNIGSDMDKDQLVGQIIELNYW